MIGRATAPVQPTARRLVQSVWGMADIDARQKWRAVWPAIRGLPRSSLRVLDAGCGDGTWTLELARRRPPWRLIGIDRDASGIARARSMTERLSIESAHFLATDFLDYQPEAPFDAVLSVASAHYLVDEGLGEPLFAKFASWLAPGGHLILYGPRRREEVPMFDGLPAPFDMREVFAPADLSRFCAGAGLEIEALTAVVHRMGTLAKQIRRLAGSSVPARALAYPIELALVGLDAIGHSHGHGHGNGNGADSPSVIATSSSALLLVARRPVTSDGDVVHTAEARR
jgi:trans-aconitate methyltransferase